MCDPEPRGRWVEFEYEITGVDTCWVELDEIAAESVRGYAASMALAGVVGVTGVRTSITDDPYRDDERAHYGG